MPIPDYSLDVPSPTDRLMQGLQVGQGLSNMMEQRRQQEAAQERQTMINTELSNLNAMERPTAADYARVASMMPKDQADSVRANWELLSKDKQSNKLRFSGQVLTAFGASPEIAIKMLKERAAAERNAGNEEDALANERWAQLAEVNPDAAKKMIGTMVAIIPGGDKVLESVGKLERGRDGGAEKPFAPVTLFNPETGEKVPHIPTFNPQTGKARLEPADLPEGFKLSKETATEKRQAEIVVIGAKARAKKLAEQAVKISGESFKKIPLIERGITNIDKAISAIDEGAKTGVINSLLPSVRTASVKLDQVANELGLDVVSSITFGALSEKELALAKETALPTKLSPPELREWLTEKRRVQQILLDKLQDAVKFLGKGGTIAELIEERQAANKLLRETPTQVTPVAAPVAAPAAPAKRLRFNPETGLIE